MATKKPPVKKAAKKKASPKKVAKKKTVRKKTAVKKKSAPKPAGAPPAIHATGQNAAALFSLKVYRGEGMALLAMNWLSGTPTNDFVGFAIEYQEPNGTQFYPVKNLLSFLDNDGNVNKNILTSRLSPIQKFRWVHFPFNANLPGNFIYQVTPVFMDSTGKLAYGTPQQTTVQLASETYPGILNVAFTRGYISSQSFVNNFGTNGSVATLLPATGTDGLKFVSKDPNEAKALDWMGFEDRLCILGLLDKAIADETAQVRATAYDFDEPEVVSRLVKLGSRLKIIIDDSKGHTPGTPASEGAAMLIKSAGANNVQRQHMGVLQHSKTIAVSGKVQQAVCGSTNFSWRGFFVQNNNAIVYSGAAPIKIFFDSFDNMWANKNNPTGFAATPSAIWNDLKLPGIKARISFSPHHGTNALLDSIGKDIASTTSSLFYSLAFLYQTKGVIRDNIKTVVANKNIFVYGLSDKAVGDLDLQLPDGNLPVAYPYQLLKNDAPEPFQPEPPGGSGIRLHHKFVVIDFDKPTARVYMGSYNFSSAADLENGENLSLIQDQRVAVSYMIQAVAMFDHYAFRDALSKAKTPTKKLYLKEPPKNPGDTTWFAEYFTDPRKIRDRELFSK